MSTPPKQNGGEGTPPETPGFLAGLFGYFSSKKSKAVERSTNSTPLDRSSQTQTSDTTSGNVVSSHINQDSNRLNGTRQNTVSFASPAPTGVATAATTSTTLVVRDFISGTPYPSRNDTSAASGALTTQDDYTSHQEPTALTATFNAASERSPWKSPNFGRGSGFTLGSPPLNNSSNKARGRDNNKSPSSGLQRTPNSTRPKRSNYTPSIFLSAGRRRGTGDMSNLSNLLRENGDLFSSKKRRKEDEKAQPVFARRGREERHFSRLALPFSTGDNDNDDDDDFTKRSSKRQKMSVRFGTDGGDDDGDDNNNDSSAPFVSNNGATTPNRNKRKDTPHKINGVNQVERGGDRQTPSSDRRMYKAPKAKQLQELSLIHI